MKGVVKCWFPAKHCGFIQTVNKTGKAVRYFLLEDRIKSGTPVLGASVDFTVYPVREGDNWSADNVQIGVVAGGAQ
jgi:hypothetical protein